MLAMVVNDNAANLTPRAVLRFIASRLAPTVDLQCYVDAGSTNRPCGSGLARDSGVTVDDDVEGDDPIANKMLPQ
jgi:hypothetical protein